ncbi:MAG: nicotinamide-nucleotide amidohydrolase family protein, partial [Candidatus Cloacimonadaceae bacterium]|nr:nicotinamide-nucleotide amidohydrolase family protein [Candidatus Cloacimonadaceae bacterium]
TAPGLYYKAGNKSFFALPGVPIELQYIFENSIMAILQRNYPSKPLIQKTLHTWGISESALAERLADFIPPSSVNMAWLPQTGRVDLRFYGNDSTAINQVAGIILETIEDVVWGVDDDTPFSVLHKILISQKKTISVAESCTGGLIQQSMTELPGSSKYLLGGVIAYSNDIKLRLLHVPQEVLENAGAVSMECAAAMAYGIKDLTNSEVAISMTGIAGPEGGSVEKPVGSVFFGIADDTGVYTSGQIFTGNRKSIRLKAAEFVVLKLIEKLRG